MRLAAVIILYNPDIDFLIGTISSLIDDVDKIVLFENSRLDRDILHSYNNNIKYLGTGNNVGMALALNQAVNWALENNYSHVMTLDQDSRFALNDLRKFKSLVNNNPITDIGIFCPNIDNRGFIQIQSKRLYVDMPDSITSGSIFPMTTFIKCGLFDERLFIDAVDYEYCYRIKSDFGLRTVIFPEIILIHEVGYPTKIRFGFLTDNYSAFRTYYIIRNHIIIWKRYPKLFQATYKKTLIKTHILYRIVKIIIGEKDKLNKLLSIARGIVHGITRK